MNYRYKINKILNDIDPGKAEFRINVSDRYIQPRIKSWEVTLEGDGFYEEAINKYANREFLSKEKKFIIDREETISTIQHRVMGRAEQMFRTCSPAKAPKRTKAYKTFRTVLYDNKGTIDFVNSIFDIAEYYHTITKTDSITDDKNDVHRKNIFQLLCLMEKNYGSKGKTSSNR